MISSFSARDGLRVAGIDVPISATAIDAQGWTHCLHLLNSRKSLFEEVLIHRIDFISREGLMTTREGERITTKKIIDHDHKN
jgi:hypothetical protein